MTFLNSDQDIYIINKLPNNLPNNNAQSIKHKIPDKVQQDITTRIVYSRINISGNHFYKPNTNNVIPNIFLIILHINKQ